MSVFFVTGLPRSRTAWLANLLCVPPASLCVHDIVGGCAGIADLQEQVERLEGGRLEGRLGTEASPYQASPYRKVGVSDPLLALVWEDVVDAWPEAKWVVLRRERRAAERSFGGFLARLGAPPALPMDLEPWELALDALECQAETRALAWEGLDDAEMVAGVCDWLRLPFRRERFEMLRRMNVQTIPERAPFDWRAAPFEHWLNERKEKSWA